MIINNINPVNLSFSSIQSVKKVGEWNRVNKNIVKAEKAFSKSVALKKYCTNNDVEVQWASEKLPYCKAGYNYTLLHINKNIESPQTILEWIKSLFKKPYEAVCVKACGKNASIAAQNLGKKISKINGNNLNDYIIMTPNSISPETQCQRCLYFDENYASEK